MNGTKAQPLAQELKEHAIVIGVVAGLPGMLLLALRWLL
jgi:hypothetical protein